MLIDCPPSLGLITVNALAAATRCSFRSSASTTPWKVSQLTRNVHLVRGPTSTRNWISRTIVLTMYDARTKLADQVAEDVREHFGRRCAGS